ncbi:MAG: CDP-alcohol phosphatidyltransferase family protein [Lysobacterales bacterium]|jgi:phosphatidylglycerophosphate synthase
MTIYAFVSETSEVHLWGLDAEQRLRRQLNEVGKIVKGEFSQVHWVDHADDLPATGQVLLFNGNFVFENRTIEGVIATPNRVLQRENEIAAAFVDAEKTAKIIDHMRDQSQQLPDGLTIIRPGDLKAFDFNLRSSTRPFLEHVSVNNKDELENKLYGNAYRGITDLVTKFVWPRPAKQMVHVCANLGITPNMVTSIGLVLVIAASFLFLHGYYAWGLLAGWIMTFLDTVDGKLARVTIRSSKFGHLYDHLIDLIHPPFWYIMWGASLVGFSGAMGLSFEQMSWAIALAYISGRCVEGLFQLLGSCEIFTWRPIDAWFRLVTARRNPCMIILTLCVLVGRPDWGFIAVTFWTVLTTVILNLRLAYAAFVRFRHGPLSSWLSEEDVATGPNAHAYTIFGSTSVSRDSS